MKHNIIKNENYLLVVNDLEIKVGDWFYLNDANIIAEYISVKPVNEAKKIIAHLPLNNSPILEGVPLLPPLEDDEAINKAKEKYKYTEEDLRNAIDMARKFPYITKGEIKFNTPIDEIIKSLQQPKMPAKRPVAFECEMKQKSVNGSIPVNQEWEYEPKTTTNPQGQTVLVGKYIY
jgi:hypothetical protein